MLLGKREERSTCKRHRGLLLMPPLQRTTDHPPLNGVPAVFFPALAPPSPWKPKPCCDCRRPNDKPFLQHTARQQWTECLLGQSPLPSPPQQPIVLPVGGGPHDAGLVPSDPGGCRHPPPGPPRPNRSAHPCPSVCLGELPGSLCRAQPKESALPFPVPPPASAVMVLTNQFFQLPGWQQVCCGCCVVQPRSSR